MKNSVALRHPDAAGSLGRTILNATASACAAFREHRRIKRDYRYLMDAEDTLLRDIGVTRDDIARASTGGIKNRNH